MAEIDLGCVVGRPGTTDYNSVENRPSINGNMLEGDKTPAELGLVADVEGMGLSHNDYTDEDQLKLGEIATAMKEEADVVMELQEAIEKKANKEEFALVAFSGNYNDLEDRPSALDGTPAGFGIPTASVDDSTGTPSVIVTASGPDTAKVFHFEFRNLKGKAGETGLTGSAGKDGGKGDRGEPGADGTRGSQWYRGTGITGTGTTATVFSGSGVSSALVNDMYLNTSTGAVYTCTAAGTASAAKWVYSGSIKGATGPQGPKGADGQANVTFATAKPSSLANGVICMVYE